MKNGWALTLLLTASMQLTGCFEEEDSCNVRTQGIFVEYRVTERSTDAKAEAVFWDGNEPGGTYLKLGSCGDDVSVNGTTLTDRGGYPTVYSATIDIADNYNIVFERPEEEASYSSEVTDMPTAVEILTPSDDSFARDESFDITWEDNSDGQINLLISSDCFGDYPEKSPGAMITDNGTHTVNAGIFDVKFVEEGNTCSAAIELTRQVDGTMSEDLDGTIVGMTMDSTTFTSIPGKDETSL